MDSLRDVVSELARIRAALERISPPPPKRCSPKKEELQRLETAIRASLDASQQAPNRPLQ
jgi:hypothetical protein